MVSPSSDLVVKRPADRCAALDRIEQLVREIQIVCDEFNFDPAEWLERTMNEQRSKETVGSESVLCLCGHDYAQHSKGAVRSDYCRHCICEKWQPADSAPRRANRCEHLHAHEDRNGNPICSDCGEEL